jgi:hypothetical protein
MIIQAFQLSTQEEAAVEDSAHQPATEVPAAGETEVFPARELPGQQIPEAAAERRREVPD